MKTSNYEAVHGVKPRGFGNWWFEITFSNGKGSYSTEQSNATGTLTEAKRAAIHELKTTCAECKVIHEIEVMS